MNERRAADAHLARGGFKAQRVTASGASSRPLHSMVLGLLGCCASDASVHVFAVSCRDMISDEVFPCHDNEAPDENEKTSLDPGLPPSGLQ